MSQEAWWYEKEKKALEEFREAEKRKLEERNRRKPERPERVIGKEVSLTPKEPVDRDAEPVHISTNERKIIQTEWSIHTS